MVPDQGADAGLVCTLRNAGPSLTSFVAHHLGQGFKHLFLFFDDPADPDIARVATNPAVTVIPHDAALRRAWERLPENATFGAFKDKEVMARQVLNVALGMELAREKNLAWLLHLDADELFHCPGQSVPAHFAWANAQKANAVKYWNYEALPEKSEIADPFREASLFKIPPALKPGPNNQEGMALLQATPQLWPDRFHFYSNGKAAVRLSARTMRPRTVHDFDDPGAPAPPLASPAQFILHYACCGFEAFWNKYQTLGKFSDTWFGKTDIRAAIGSSLHLESRDVVATGNREQALDFYRRRVALEDSARAEALIRHGVLARIKAFG